jgi:O-antigen/teichoic acid export membrane protein
MNNVNSSKLDSYGMGVGIACAVHCAVFPLIFSSGFMASASWMDHMFLDIIFLVASLYFAFNSLVRSYGKEHNNVLPLLFAVVGFIIIGYILISHNHNQLILPTVGGLLLAAAHFYNYRLTHQALAKA